MKLPTQNWHFIQDYRFREILIRDYAELRRLQKIPAHKSTILLCGSMLEAVLLTLLQKPLIPQSRLRLEDLINEAKGKHLLDADAHKRALVIQDYRNLIHPKVEIELDAHIDENLAKLSLGAFLNTINVLRLTSAKNALSQEAQFLDLLEHKRSKAEADIAREIITWAKQHGLELVWSPTLTFLPVFSHQGIGYEPIGLSATGRLYFRLGDLKKGAKSPFKKSAKRTEFLKRLNAIHGIRFQADKASKFPAVGLAKLESLEIRTAIFDVLDWALAMIRDETV